jgi:hypothetical protein
MVTGVTADRPKTIENTESNPKIRNLLISLIEVGLACMVTGVTADIPKKIENTESNPKIQNLLISLIGGPACMVTAGNS